MSDLDLTQTEADFLLAMGKQRVDEKAWDFPKPGQKIAIPLTSYDKRESFLLDITRAAIKPSKVTYQTRTHITVLLIRLDIGGAPHRNPDGQEIPCPHIHLYREGFGMKWAQAAPEDIYPDFNNSLVTLESFLYHCRVTDPPVISMELF